MPPPSVVPLQSATSTSCDVPTHSVRYLITACRDLCASGAGGLGRQCGTRLLRVLSAELPAARRQAAALPVLSVVCAGCGTYFLPPRNCTLRVLSSHGSHGDGAGGAAEVPPRVLDLAAQLDGQRIATRHSLSCHHCGMVTVTAVQATQKTAHRLATEEGEAAPEAVRPAAKQQQQQQPRPQPQKQKKLSAT
eukprot:Rhum_TRINITY_DN14308_c21_g1::Rhum_TRINITY_DN14308_c21_g1_i1::g.80869::m.80869